MKVGIYGGISGGVGSSAEFDTETNELKTHRWLTTEANSRVLDSVIVDGVVAGISGRGSEVTPWIIGIDTAFFGVPTDPPAEIQEQYMGSGLSRQILMPVKFCSDGTRVVALHVETEKLVIVDFLGGTPVSTTQEFGTWQMSSVPLFAEFEDGTYRLFHIDQQEGMVSLSTPVGDGSQLNKVLQFSYTTSDLDYSGELSKFAAGTVIVGRLAALAKDAGLGVIKSFDAVSLEQVPSGFLEVVQGRFSAPDDEGRQRLGIYLSFPDRIIKELTVSDSGAYEEIYSDYPILPPGFDQGSISIRLTPPKVKPPFWHNFVRTFETIE